MTPAPLETVEVEPRGRADATVILMHGLGADGHDFEPVVAELRLESPHAVRFVFPHAPVRPVTINAGHRMRAWYDIVALDRRAPEDEVGLREAAAGVSGLVERERARGVPTERIVLAGFSQGGAVALHTAVRASQRLAGVVGLSTYLPLVTRLAEESHPANRATPIFLAHGTFDLVVPFALGEGSRDALRAHGYEVSWHTFPMAHSVSAEEIALLRTFLVQALPAKG